MQKGFLSIRDHILAKDLTKQIQHNFLITAQEQKEIDEKREQAFKQMVMNLNGMANGRVIVIGL